MHRSPQKSANRDINLSQYKSSLLKTFTHLFHEHQDIMLNLSIKLPMPNPKREEILFSQYPMQKKGKTLGTTEMRRVRIQDGRLVQVGGESGQKEFPMPNQLKREKYVQGLAGWAQKQYLFRISLQFSQRSPIAIYMKNAEQQLQLFSYLHAKSRPYTSQILKQAYTKCYKQKLYNAWLSKLLNIKMSKNYNTQTLEKRRLSTINKIRFAYKDKKKLKDLIYHWHELAVMKVTEKPEKGIMDVKQIVSELSFLVSMVKVPAYLNIRSGQLKLWIGQTTHQKMLIFNKQNSNIQQIPDLTEQQQPNNIENVQKLYDVVQIFYLQDAEMMLRNLSTPLSIWSILQFQIDTKGENGISRCWRSDRFYVMDYLKSITRGPKKSVALWSSKQCIQIFLTSTSCKTQILKIQHPPQHPTLPSSYTFSLTPHTYTVLQSQIPQTILSKYIKSINPQSLHLQYTIAYQQYLQCQAIQSLCFSSIHRIYQLLDIDGIIDKFYLTMPYASYRGSRGRGTVVYEILVGKSQKFWFYDAEKYAWRNPGHIGMRRLLSVIKAFDQMPRINFNQPFHQLCLQCLKISQDESILKQKPQNFDNTVLGRESLAFFIILGILKCSSQLLLHQPNKRYLANNSLLFHYIFKKYVNTLYHKFLHLQLNIEAYFGILSVGLFAGLFNLGTGNGDYGGSHQGYLFILSCYLQQRKQQQLQSQSSSPIRQPHYLSLISTFLSLLQLFETTQQRKNKQKNKDKMYPQITNQLTSTSAAYTNPYNYMFNFKLFVCCELETYFTQFMAFYHKYFKLCLKVVSEDQGYAQLYTNMGKFYDLENGSQGNLVGQGSVSVKQLGLGELMEQLYTQFSAYKHKNQADIRKISIIIDHIHLGDCLSSTYSSSPTSISSSTSYKPPCLHIQLSQQSTKLYQHQYILGTNPKTSHSLHHKIQQKLNRLHPITLTLTLTYRNISQSYFTRIDPKQIPSNVYIQQINQMHSVSGNRLDGNGTVDVYVWRYAALQIFIKDSCDVDVLENVVPGGYVNGLLLAGRVGDDCPQDYKRDIIFANHYFRSFRLTQNNFNLLFAKLGWYGNHYLIPTSRITSLSLTHSPIPPTPSNPSLQQFLSSNKPQLPISQLPIHDTKRINQILFYTRCIYGRGIIPSIAYSGCNNNKLIMESIRNDHCIIEQKQFKNQINQCVFNCCGNLVGYLLDNFQGWKQVGDGGGNGGFMDFYIKATEQLPLIRYLTFRPLQFYLLQQITINLKIVSTQTKPDPSRNHIINPQNYTSLKHIAQSQALDKQTNNQQLITRQYKIILTNHEISTSTSTSTSIQHQQQNYAYQFIADSSILTTKLYAQFMGNDDISNIYDMKLLYHKLSEGLELPLLMYFTLPYAMVYDQEQFGINGPIPIYLDAFMYLLQLNIMYYYVLKKNLKAVNNVTTQKQKQKQKQKPRQKAQNPQIIGCRFKSCNPAIPNIPLSTLLPILYQTKQPLTIHALPLTSTITNQSPPSPPPSSSSYPIILNPLYRHYTSFAYIANIWKQVCILSKIITPSYVFYYVEEARTRIYRLMKASDVIFGFEAKKVMDRLYLAKFTDFEVLGCKDCVKKELNRIL